MSMICRTRSVLQAHPPLGGGSGVADVDIFSLLVDSSSSHERMICHCLLECSVWRSNLTMLRSSPRMLSPLFASAHFACIFREELC